MRMLEVHAHMQTPPPLKHCGGQQLVGGGSGPLLLSDTLCRRCVNGRQRPFSSPRDARRPPFAPTMHARASSDNKFAHHSPRPRQKRSFRIAGEFECYTRQLWASPGLDASLLFSWFVRRRSRLSSSLLITQQGSSSTHQPAMERQDSLPAPQQCAKGCGFFA